jgi:hypothetical protein
MNPEISKSKIAQFFSSKGETPMEAGITEDPNEFEFIDVFATHNPEISGKLSVWKNKNIEVTEYKD